MNSTYTITSSYKMASHKDDSEDIWKSTSKWREYQVSTLKIRIVDGDVVRQSELDSMTISDEVRSTILLPSITIDNRHPPSELTKRQKKFYNRVIQISDSSDEPPVDLVVIDLLDSTDFESDDIHFRLYPHIEMIWKDHNISSEPDFGIYSDMPRGHWREYMMVVENKRLLSRSIPQAERQLRGEMLVAVCDRASYVKVDQEIYGMTVIGLSVRFYRAIFPEKYLREILGGDVPSSYVDVIRYPSDRSPPFSISRPGDRENIAKMLCCIRNRIISLL